MKAALALLFLVGCRRSGPAPASTIRLADLYTQETVEGRLPLASPPPPTEWRFTGPAPEPAPAQDAATRGWGAFHSVSGLAIADGRLRGRSTDELPIIHFERASGILEPDLVHELQVRMKASAGTTLGMSFIGSEKIDEADALDYARHFTWDFTTPLVAGDEMRTYTLKTTLHVLTSRTRHILLRPTDAAGATFEIESVRLVSRREHLAAVPSGLGWQGLSEIYRETLVARSPETLRFSLRMPARPRLDLSLGTIEEGPVTFRVSGGPVGAPPATLLERTITRAHRWEDAPLDLSTLAGREATLSFSIAADKPGTIGFWGGPTVRSLGALPAPSAASPAPGERPQGVIVVWMDTLRRDHLGAYGYARPTSPVIDRLAAEGTLFRDCIGHASWTKVATPSLMTSLYPSAHGVRDFADRLPGSATTLAEIYRQGGYATVSYSSILFTGKFTNLHQGFEEVHEDGSLPERGSSKTARDYVDRLAAWLEGHREVPFFAFLHVADPHDPYRPRPPYDTTWADPTRREEHEKQDKDLRKHIADPLLRHMGSSMPTREELVKAGVDADRYVGYDRDWYDGSIRGLDAELGRLVERLKALGLDRRTLVVLAADHGEEFLEHGRTFHGQSVYGELNNMPLVMWSPALLPHPRAVEQTVQVVDIMPTLLEISGLPVPAGIQGRSLVPLLFPVSGSAPGGAQERPAISEKAFTTDKGAPPPRDTESTAIVFQGFKLIHHARRPAGVPEYELFDHRRDPLDQADVRAQHPEVVARLIRELEAWRKTVAVSRLKPDTEATKSLSPDEIERLRALGYIQ